MSTQVFHLRCVAVLTIRNGLLSLMTYTWDLTPEEATARTLFEDSPEYLDYIVTPTLSKTKKRKAQRLMMKSFPGAFALLRPTPLRGRCGQERAVPTASHVSSSLC